MPALPERLLLRFISRVGPADENGCWPWIGTLDPHGYGKISLRPYFKTRQATRISYMLAYGDFDERLLVCHTCDNPPCVNPDHLWLGTQSDNLRDMVEKGRGRHIQPTPEQAAEVLEIRRLYATGRYTHRDLSAMFKCSSARVQFITQGRSYESVGGPIVPPGTRTGRMTKGPPRHG